MRINESLITFVPDTGSGSGSVTSVALSAPTGFTVTGSPITSSGTLALSFTTGYGIPPLMTGNSGKFLTTNGTTMSWANIAGTDVTGAALTEVDDTNVTCTLGGTPATSLLRSVSLTFGWAGQLAVSRGGTGAATLTGVLIGNGTSAVTAVVGGPNQILRRNSAGTAYEFYTASFLTNPMTLNYDMIYQDAGVPARLASNITTTKQFLTSIGNGTATTSLAWGTINASDINNGAALTRTNDTNVQITLGGNATDGLVKAISLTMGWTGQLAVSRGGTGASTLSGIVVGNGTSAMTALASTTAQQLLRVNTLGTAYEWFTPQYLVPIDIQASSPLVWNAATKTMSIGTITTLGTITTGVWQATPISPSYGGTGATSITGVVIGNGIGTMTGVAGTADQLLRRNSANTAYEFFTPTYLSNVMTSLGDMIYGNAAGAPLRLAANGTSVNKYLRSVNGNPPTWEQIQPSDIAGGAATGSGTTNFVPIWTSSTALGSSALSITGGEANFGNNKLVAGNVSATNGSIMLQDNYSSGHFGNIGTMFSGANLMLGYGVTPSTSSATGFLSSVFVSGNPYSRSAIVLGEDIFFYTASAQSIAIGSSVSMSERIRITNSGNLGIGNTPSHKLDVNGIIGLAGVGFAGNSGNDNVIYDGSSGGSIYLGGTTNLRNAYNNTTHYFQSRGGGTTFATINSGGLVINSGSIQIPSTFNLTWGGAYGTDIPTISGTSGGGSNGFLQFYPAGSTSGVKMALRRTGQLALTSYTTSTSFSGTAVATLAVTNAGDVITIAPSQTTASGTYTPTWTGLANVDSTTAYTCQYSRVGDTVTVSGYVMINATADNTPTRLSITLPISSTTSSVNYANGTIAQVGGGASGSIIGYGSNTAEIGFSVLANTGDVYYSFIFAYRII